MAAAAVFMISCSGGDDTPPVVNNEAVLLKKMIETSEDGTLITLLTYNGTKLVEINSNDGSHQVLTYTGDLITEWKRYEDSELSSTDTYVYNSENKLITYTSIDAQDSWNEKITYVHNADGSIDYKEYTGATPSLIDQLIGQGKIYANKLTEVQTFGTTDVTYTSTFTFDGKNNPLKNITGYDKIAFANTMESTNYLENITSESSSSSNNQNTPELETTYTYTYNAQNYPLTVIETDVEYPNSAITTQYSYE